MSVKMFNDVRKLKGKAPVSPMDFGAIGDGVEDDTQAFQQALDALGQLKHTNAFADYQYERGGGELFIPAGIYLITDSLLFSSSNIIRGIGRGSVILFRPKVANTDLFIIDPDRMTPASYRGTNIVFKDLVVTGDLQDAIGVAGNRYARCAFNFEYCSFTKLENVTIQNFWYGVRYGSNWGYYQQINQCMFYNCGSLAIDIGDSGGPVLVLGGDITRSADFLTLVAGNVPEYAIKTEAQLTLIDVGMEMGSDVSVAYLREEGQYAKININSGRFENSRPLLSSDINPQKDVGGPKYKFTSIGAKKDYEPASYIRIDPIESVGSPLPVFLKGLDVEDNYVINNNFDFSKQFWGWQYNASIGAMSYDTTQKFFNNGSLKLQWNSGSPAGLAGLTMKVDYNEIKNYIGKRLHFTFATRIDDQSGFSAIQTKIYQVNQEGNYKYLPLMDSYGDLSQAHYTMPDGSLWKWWEISFVPSSGTSGDNLQLSFEAAKPSTSTSGIIYLGYFGIFENGYPLAPVNVNPTNTCYASKVPTYSRYKNGFNVGDRIYSLASSGVGWVCTTASGGAFSAIGAGVSDHGTLSGLGDDDHNQYVPTNASRGFTAKVSGVDPSASYHLATKAYVDRFTSTLTGPVTLGGAVVIDWNDGVFQKVELSDNCSINFSDPTVPGTYTLLIDTNSHICSGWDSSILWPDGTIPKLSLYTDAIRFLFDGTNYYGSWVGGFK